MVLLAAWDLIQIQYSHGLMGSWKTIVDDCHYKADVMEGK